MINIIFWATLVLGSTWLIIKVARKYWNNNVHREVEEVEEEDKIKS